MPTKTNSTSLWDEIWSREGIETWRRYPGPFGRIVWLLENVTREIRPLDSNSFPTLVDLGCGVGVLMRQIKDKISALVPNADYKGVDLSPVAIETALREGNIDWGEVYDLEEDTRPLPTGDILIATEVLEHLTTPAVRRILEHSKDFGKCFFMVPNYCLGPDTEEQHIQMWTPLEFKRLLREYHEHVRVECVGYDRDTFLRTGHRGYLLGVCGYPKSYTMALTLPVKNEEEDIERVLASFYGAADEVVIGVDDLSDDKTEEIVGRYADVSFKFTWEKDFSKARNACIERCTADWIFMTEGHESLHRGLQVLLQLEEIPDWVHVLEVKREALNNIWYFPWLFRNHKGLFYKNAVHNVLTGYEEKSAGKTPQISTWHDRSLAKSMARAEQRSGMNKQELLKRVRTGDSRAMYYLGSEYRDLFCRTCNGMGVVKRDRTIEVLGTGEKVEVPARSEPCPACAIETTEGNQKSLGIRPIGIRQSVFWFENFLRACPPCEFRYQGRLSLGSLYINLERWNDAKRVLAPAVVDDATRIEHWMMLGDVCEKVGQMELAMRFYEYAAVGIGRPPSSFMFIDKAMYSYLPAQKLCAAYDALGMYAEALEWAKKVPGLMPEWASQAAREEVDTIIQAIEQRLNEQQQESSNVA